MAVKQQTLKELGRRVLGSRKVIRGKCVLLDVDLADVYGVPITELRQRMARNAKRFPADLAFRLSPSESRCLNKLSIQAVWAFTDQGSLMLANLLNSPIAIEVSVRLVRALVAGQTGAAFALLARATQKADS
jgi:hypothetical protein